MDYNSVFVLLRKALGLFVMLMWQCLSVSTIKHNKSEKSMQLIKYLYLINIYSHSCCSNLIRLWLNFKNDLS